MSSEVIKKEVTCQNDDKSFKIIKHKNNLFFHFVLFNRK